MRAQERNLDPPYEFVYVSIYFKELNNSLHAIQKLPSVLCKFSLADARQDILISLLDDGK